MITSTYYDLELNNEQVMLILVSLRVARGVLPNMDHTKLETLEAEIESQIGSFE